MCMYVNKIDVLQIEAEQFQGLDENSELRLQWKCWIFFILSEFGIMTNEFERTKA